MAVTTSITERQQVGPGPIIGTFRWFRLPAELRNRIYGMAADYRLLGRRQRPRHLPKWNNCPVVLRLVPAPMSNVARISKRVQAEYLHELRNSEQTLQWRPKYERGRYDFSLDKAALKIILRHAKKVKLLVISLQDEHYEAAAYSTSENSWILQKVRNDLALLLEELRYSGHILFSYRTTGLSLQDESVDAVQNDRSIDVLAKAFLHPDIRKAYLERSIKQSRLLETEILFRHELYSPYQTPGWKPVMAKGTHNWVEYRGTISDRSDAWWGLDLDVVSCGELREEELPLNRDQATLKMREQENQAHETRIALSRATRKQANASPLARAAARAAHERRCALHRGRILDKFDNNDNEDDDSEGGVALG